MLRFFSIQINILITLKIKYNFKQDILFSQLDFRVLKMVKYWFAFAAWIKILQFISATCEGAGVTRIICSHIELSTGNDTCIVESK